MPTHTYHLSKNTFFAVVAIAISVFSCVEVFAGVNIGYYFHQDAKDSFMDLFNSVIKHFLDQETKKTFGIYPPFAEFPYSVLSRIVPDTIDTSMDVREQAFALKLSYEGALMLLWHVVIFFLGLFISLIHAIEGSLPKKTFYAFLVSFSGVVFWAVERGNLIVYAFLFTLFFFLLYESENPKVRILSYLCLVIAAGLKLYPAIFALVLIKDGRWKILCGCIIVFVFSYMCIAMLGGYSLASMKDVIPNLMRWSNDADHGMGLNCSIKNFILCINGFLRMVIHVRVLPKAYPDFVFYIVQALWLFFGIFSFVFSRQQWKKLFSLSLMCIYIPSISYMYTMIFLIIPLIYFLNEEETSERGALQFFFAFGFGVLLSFFILPVQFPGLTYFVTGNFIVQQIVMMLMFLVVLAQSCGNWLRLRKSSD